MDGLEEALNLLEELDTYNSEHQLEVFYSKTSEEVEGGPYEWQVEFHEMGSQKNHRAIIAANRTGKTRSAAAEIAMHVTGQYPDWWKGKRFTQANDWCVCGQTNEEVRNIVQKALFGKIIKPDGENRKPDGTGWVPKECIKDWGFRQCGVPDVLDTVTVKHSTGKMSVVMLKSYEQGPLKFQGFEVDGMWFDEEPEDDKIYPEAITRILTRKGIFMFTRTPLFGASEIVLKFLHDESGVTWFTNVGWAESPHLDETQKAEMLALYPEHERDTRTKGHVLMGSGAVYPIADDELLVTPFEIPKHFRRLVGIDFGIDHPAAAVWIAHDADNDIVYVTDCYRKSGQTAAYHSAAIMDRGEWIPVAWPHDGMIRDKGSGEPLKDQYESRGVNMLWCSARYDDTRGGGQGTEPVVIANLERMRTGRLKVFETCQTWILEKNLYHREDGVIKKIRDDVMAGFNYAMMMLRYAETEPSKHTQNQVAQGLDWDPLAEFSL